MTDERHDIPEHPVDLSSLDPRDDVAHMNVLVGRIVADGMAARASLGRSDDLSAQLARWARPVLLAASLVLAISLPTAIQAGRELAQRVAQAQSSAPVLDSRFGLPAPVVALTQSGRSPSAGEIAAAFDAQWTERIK